MKVLSENISHELKTINETVSTKDVLRVGGRFIYIEFSSLSHEIVAKHQFDWFHYLNLLKIVGSVE